MSAFAGSLLRWFRRNARDLPWRHERSPYRVAVSEVMLQQTTVTAVVPHFERFLARFPSWEALASAAEADVVQAWAGLGYYRRARSLHALARAVVAAGGEFPRSMDEALALPGVGPYTAGAVLSLAHGIAAPAVDGNVVRVLSRRSGRPLLAATVRDRREAEALVMRLQPPHAPGEFNEALMELGATTCTPVAPSCERCPVARGCVARTQGRVAELPPPRVRRAAENVAAAAAVIERGGRVLLRRIPEGAPRLGGLWELPGGWTGGAAPDAWLRANVLAAFGVGEVGERLGEIRHAITHRRITVSAWRCTLRRPPAATQDLAWVRASEAASLGLTAAARKVLRLPSVAIRGGAF